MLRTVRLRANRLRGMPSVFALGTALIMTMPSPAVQTAAAYQSNPPVERSQAEATLRARMTGYWDAMQSGKYEVAARYIHPDSRNLFLYEVPKSRVVRWKIDKLRFNEEYTACDTVTLVTKPFPVWVDTADWLLHNRWVLVDGEWYFKLPWEKGHNPLVEMFKAQGTGGVTREPPPQEPPPAPVRPSPIQRLTPHPSNPQRVHFGEKVVFRFDYRNTGSAPMRIKSAHADCRCAAVASEHPEIAPGGAGTLEVTLDTFGLPLGPLEKEIRIEFSDAPIPVSLRIHVENVANFAIEPRTVDFGAVAAGETAERTVRIVNQSGRRLNFPPPSHADARLHISLDRSELAPGEAATVTLRYKAAAGTARGGALLDNVLFQTGLDAEPMFSLRVSGTIR